MSTDEILIELLLQLQKAPPDDARAILNGQPQISYEAMTLMVKMGAVDVQTFVKRLESYGVSASSRTPAAPPTQPSLPPHLHPSRAAQLSVPSSTPPYTDSNPTAPGPSHQQQGPDMYGRRNNAPYSQNSRAPYPPGPPNAYQQPPPNSYQHAPPQSYQQVPPSTSYPPRGPNSHDFNPANQYGRPDSGIQHGRRPPDNYTQGRYSSAPSHPNMGPPPGADPSRPPAAASQSLPPGMLDQFPPEQRAMIQRVISMSADEIQRLPTNERNNIMQIRATLGLPPP